MSGVFKQHIVDLPAKLTVTRDSSIHCQPQLLRKTTPTTKPRSVLITSKESPKKTGCQKSSKGYEVCSHISIYRKGKTLTLGREYCIPKAAESRQVSCRVNSGDRRCSLHPAFRICPHVLFERIEGHCKFDGPRHAFQTLVASAMLNTR